MYLPSLPDTVFCLLLLQGVQPAAAAGSFYDDAPLEFPSEADRSVGELERKWGVDVSLSSSCHVVSLLLPVTVLVCCSSLFELI